MGLPLFVTPVEPTVAKAAEKIAAGSRSSIRRPRVFPSAFQGRASRTPWVGEAFLRRRFGPEADAEDYEVVEAQEEPSANALDVPGPNVHVARSMRILEHGRMRLRDSLSFERERLPETDVDAPMPPVPESRDYSDRERILAELHLRRQRDREEGRGNLQETNLRRHREMRSSRDTRRVVRRRPAPTLGYTPQVVFQGVASGAEGVVGSPRLSSIPFSPTPARSPTNPFAPSDVAYYSAPTADQQARNRRALDARDSLLRDAATTQTRTDGLGDRDRSLSPDGGVSTWDILQGGITPDPQPPSAGSSFASTAAAASSSGSGRESSSTSMTSADQTRDSPNFRDCDITVSDANTEDEDEDDVYELQNLDSIRDLWNASSANAQPERGVRHSATPDRLHIEETRRIISRMVEQNEVPDEWWASVGLSRML